MVYVLLAKATSIGHSLETDPASGAPICERASIEGHRTCRPAWSRPSIGLGINAYQDASESKSQAGRPPARSLGRYDVVCNLHRGVR